MGVSYLFSGSVCYHFSAVIFKDYFSLGSLFSLFFGLSPNTCVRYPLVTELILQLLGSIFNAFKLIVLKSIEVIAIDFVFNYGWLLIFPILSSLVPLLFFDKEAIKDQEFFKFLFSLEFSEKLLGVGSCLSTSTCTDEILDLDPVLAENFETLNEFFMLFLGPAAAVCISIIFCLTSWTIKLL